MLNRSHPSALTPKSPPPAARRGSTVRPSPVPQSGASVLRRPGGQPGNRNARKHGQYSARLPHPSARFVPAPPPVSLLLGAEGDPRSTLAGLKTALAHSRRKAAKVAEFVDRTQPTSEFLVWTHVVLKHFAAGDRLMTAIHKLQRAQALLPDLAGDAHRLIDREFMDRNIPEHTIFVPLPLGNFYANPVLSQAKDLPLSAGGPILTDSQWFLIKESLTSLRQDLDYFRKNRRRKPLPNVRLLMEGILLKLAFGLRWQDVPTLIGRLHPPAAPFPLRACQRLHRDLFNSGRLRAIYRELDLHLHVYGQTSLRELVDQGHFKITGSRLVLSAGGPASGAAGKLTWQKFTALLLLQRALHSQRVHKREQDYDRRRNGLYWRLPPLPPLLRLPLRRSPLMPSQTADTSSGIFEPLESSLAWKKWQKQEQINNLSHRSPLSKSEIWGGAGGGAAARLRSSALGVPTSLEAGPPDE